MSQMTAAAARVGVRAPRRQPTLPSLRVVSGAETKKPGAGFAVLCMLLLSAGLLGLLLLNTTLAQAPSRCTTCRPPPVSSATPRTR